jgi:VIT1/CCC1 family predicted Fe2+/Mn2+ transporter/rubrerythrin
MNGLSDIEKKKLLNAAKKIHTHKLVQIKGYRTLVGRASDERIKHLLIQIADEEEKHAEFWSERIQELGGEREGKTGAYLRGLKLRSMMSILGTKGFFEWAVVGEDEGIQDLSVQAEKISDRESSETWSRFASDERMHLERMKTEILGMEEWEIRGGGGVRDMIFGANDGMVSTLSFVAGVVGAITDPYIVLLSGVAELFAGTISMAFGSYLSAKSELEVWERESQRKEGEKGKTPEEEREELIGLYEKEGFKRGEAEAIVERLSAEKEVPIQAQGLEELGLAPEELGNPVKEGLLCGVSFGLAALVPLLPFIFHGLSSREALTISIIAALIALFGVGSMKTIFSRKSWVRSGLEMMLIGASGAAITYMIGTFFSLIVHA